MVFCLFGGNRETAFRYPLFRIAGIARPHMVNIEHGAVGPVAVFLNPPHGCDVDIGDLVISASESDACHQAGGQFFKKDVPGILVVANDRHLNLYIRVGFIVFCVVVGRGVEERGGELGMLGCDFSVQLFPQAASSV